MSVRGRDAVPHPLRRVGACGACGYTPRVEDERREEGMPVLDRQAVRDPATPPGSAVVPPSLLGRPVHSVPETKPTPLQKHYVLISAPALVLGAVAITALELGAPLGSQLVKGCVLVAAPLLAIANADAIVRIWRSAWAWMPVDRAKGLFRLVWVAAGITLYAFLVGTAWLVLAA
jgi:hypothetical protein